MQTGAGCVGFYRYVFVYFFILLLRFQRDFDKTFPPGFYRLLFIFRNRAPAGCCYFYQEQRIPACIPEAVLCIYIFFLGYGSEVINGILPDNIGKVKTVF